jgi:hypothetical protein
LTLFRSDWVPTQPTGLCGACGYDLTGLPDDSPCPECASLMRGFTRPRREIRLNAQRVPPWLLGVAIILLAACLGIALPEEILVHIYRAEGFTEETARHVIPIRELHEGPWPLLGPLWVACGFVPLLSMIRRRLWSCAASLILTAAAILLSLACFAAQ